MTDDPPVAKIIDVMIFKMRKKLPTIQDDD